MVIKVPGLIYEQSKTYIKFSVTQQIVSLNQHLPNKKAIERCKEKHVEWEYLANKWQRYKTAWAKALTVVPRMDRVESYSVTTIVSDRSRLIDLENLWGGSKPIRDSLERRGWIWNDSPKWSDLIITQRKVKKGEEKTWIKIELKNILDTDSH